MFPLIPLAIIALGGWQASKGVKRLLAAKERKESAMSRNNANVSRFGSSRRKAQDRADALYSRQLAVKRLMERAAELFRGIKQPGKVPDPKRLVIPKPHIKQVTAGDVDGTIGVLGSALATAIGGILVGGVILNKLAAANYESDVEKLVEAVDNNERTILQAEEFFSRLLRVIGHYEATMSQLEQCFEVALDRMSAVVGRHSSGWFTAEEDAVLLLVSNYARLAEAMLTVQLDRKDGTKAIGYDVNERPVAELLAKTKDQLVQVAA